MWCEFKGRAPMGKPTFLGIGAIGVVAKLME